MKFFYLMKPGVLVLFLFLTLTAFAQSGSITGTVVDETNQPLPGASVTLAAGDAAARTTTTDAQGRFAFNNVSNGTATISVTFIGYKLSEQRVAVNGATTVSVSMSPDAQSLNEVVVIGYGTQQKKDITGAGLRQ